MTDPSWTLFKDQNTEAVDIYGYQIDPCGAIILWHTSRKKSEPDIIYAPGTWTHLIKDET